jgi:anti-sigma regulatory factor (Ser/Thr protein kinase)
VVICTDGGPRAVTERSVASPRSGGMDTDVHFCFEARAHPGVVALARRCARHTLAAWRLGQFADDIELLISELLTNAVQASLATRPADGSRAAAPVVTLCLTLGSDQLTVLVRDCCPEPPRRRADAGHDDEAGRGLVIVQAISDDWGIRAAADGGKVVWAQFLTARS